MISTSWWLTAPRESFTQVARQRQFSEKGHQVYRWDHARGQKANQRRKRKPKTTNDEEV